MYTNDDWLATKIESGQTAKRYSMGSPSINWVDHRVKRIVLFMIDESIDEQSRMELKAYCEAYFYGMNVELVRPGGIIREILPNNKKGEKKKTPE